MHTYNVRTFTNPRNGEDNVRLDLRGSSDRLSKKMLENNLSLGRICVKGIQISTVEEADANFRDLRYYLNQGDPRDNQGLTMGYFLRQLYSLDQVTQLWGNQHGSGTAEHYTAANGEAKSNLVGQVDQEGPQKSYDIVIYTRPDLFFFDELPITSECKVKEYDLAQHLS